MISDAVTASARRRRTRHRCGWRGCGCGCGCGDACATAAIAADASVRRRQADRWRSGGERAPEENTAAVWLLDGRRARGRGRDSGDRGGCGRGGGTTARRRDDGQADQRRSDGEHASEANTAAARLVRTRRHNAAQRCGTTAAVSAAVA